MNSVDLASIKSSTHRILSRELSPRLSELEDKGEFGRQALRELGKNGLAAPMLPEPFGIDDLFAQAVVSEEMGYFSSGFGLSALASVCLFGANVGRLGTDEQKRKYLPGIASGEKIGCWALTEPGVGSDAVAVHARSERVGDHYILNGSKTFITNAPIADYFIVITREFEGGKPIEGFRGGTAFILERGTSGLRTGQPLEKLGHWCSPTGEVFLENVKVPASQVLGQPREAFSGMKLSLDVERAIFGGLGLGIIAFCLESVVRYTSERKQFGVSLSTHQLIQEKIAEIASSLDLLRVYQRSLLEKITRDEPATKEAAIFKLWTARATMQSANEAVQCLGGYGYMREYQVERCLRDAKLFEIGGGTSEIQKLIIAKQALKEILSERGSA